MTAACPLADMLIRETPHAGRFRGGRPDGVLEEHAEGEQRRMEARCRGDDRVRPE